jgi:hypothetical protein
VISVNTVELKNIAESVLWAQPSRSAMLFRLGMSYARGIGQVPV